MIIKKTAVGKRVGKMVKRNPNRFIGMSIYISRVILSFCLKEVSNQNYLSADLGRK